jgi:hypothetical protein
MKKIALTCLSCCWWLWAQGQNNIHEIEYFFNSDPGYTNGVDVPFGADAFTVSDLPIVIDISTLAEGFNMLHVRARNDSGWSVAAIKPIYVFSAVSVSISDITKLEYFIDSDPGYDGGIDVAITPGTELTDVNFAVDLSALTEGFHTLHVRALDANGQWGVAHVKSIFVLAATSISLPNITEMEYFIDADLGYGAGTPITGFSAGTTVTNLSFSVDVSLLSDGFHTLNIRAKDENGRWGDAYVKSIFILSASVASLPEIIKMEYFFDGDPGYGSAIDVPLTANDTITNLSFEVATDTLSNGFHVLNVRTQDENGTWSTAYNKPVFIVGGSTAPNIVALEYFFDDDPGVGNGSSLPVTPSVDIVDLVVGANISALVVGPHLLHVRARDANGVWSTTESYPFEACIQDAPIAGLPLGLSYDTFIANWSSALDAVTYQLDVSTDTLTTFLPGFESKSLTVLRDTLAGLSPLTHFQYRVRALGPDNCLSINSDTIYVRTNSTLAIDTDALIALYNATNGANWTNNTGWLSGLASNAWSGVTVVDENVVALTLPNNNIVGSIPEDVLNVSKLAGINLSGNEINAVPDFSGLPDATSVDLSDNQLDFGDLEPNLDVTGIAFLNQKKIGVADTDTVNVSNAYAMSAVVGGSANQYQWSLNGNSITDASSNMYTINSFAKDDRGVYECTITSGLIPALILKTNPRTLVGVATVSGALFASANVPVSGGTVQLLKITSGGYDSIPETPLPVNADGTFTFEKILLDDYLLVGLADTLLYPRALPTYVPGTAYWEEADTITLEANISGLGIVSVLEPTDQLTGEGLLFGFVEEDDGAGGRVEKTTRVAGAGVSARRSQGVGRGKETFEIVGYVFTNDDGEFSIEGLPPGTYRFNVQYPGYPMDTTTFIDFIIGSNALEETVQVKATVEGEKISVEELVITKVFERKDYMAEVSPNPSSENIKIEFPDVSIQRSITLTDHTGRKLMGKKATEKVTVLNVKDLPAGMYLLNIVDKGEVKRIVKVVKQ